jgi:hypothetical protein
VNAVASTTGKSGSQAASTVSGRLLVNGLESGVWRIRPNGYLLLMSYFVWLPRLCFAAATVHPAAPLDLTEVRERFRSDRAGGKLLRLRVQSGCEEQDDLV